MIAFTLVVKKIVFCLQDKKLFNDYLKDKTNIQS